MKLLRMIMVALSAVMITTTAAPASAGASTRPQVLASTATTSTFTSGVTITPLDPVTMKPSGTTKTVVSDSLAHPSCPEGSTDCLSASYYTGGSATPSGCAQLRVYVHSHDLLGGTAYYFNQYTKWCWGFGTVVNPKVWTTLSSTDGFHYNRGTGPRWDLSVFYNWISWVTHSGYFASRDATIENCVPIWGCVGVEYPWTWARVHGNGTYSYDWGYS